MLLLEDDFPNFKANTTIGVIDLYEYMNDSWCMLFSHPADFTPVCTTELAHAAKLASEFEKRNVKLLALSCSPLDAHKIWIADIKSYAGLEKSSDFPYPIIDDRNRDIAVMLGMIHPEDKNNVSLPITIRHCFIISPDKKLKLILLYPDQTGRNFNEILRAIDSLQIAYKHNVYTPANWHFGERCMIPETVRDDEFDLLYPMGFDVLNMPSGRSYMRLIDCPRHV